VTLGGSTDIDFTTEADAGRTSRAASIDWDRWQAAGPGPPTWPVLLGGQAPRDARQPTADSLLERWRLGTAKEFAPSTRQRRLVELQTGRRM